MVEEIKSKQIPQQIPQGLLDKAGLVIDMEVPISAQSPVQGGASQVTWPALGWSRRNELSPHLKEGKKEKERKTGSQEGKEEQSCATKM